MAEKKTYIGMPLPRPKKPSQKKKINKIYEGFLYTCDYVAESMGAEGGFGILLDRSQLKAPISTKDGVSICRNVYFENPYKNAGAYFAKQAAIKTVLKAGDATTTTLVFAKSIVKNGKGYYNSDFRNGVYTAQKEVFEILDKIKKETDSTSLYNVAKISANNDEAIAKIVMEAFEKVGKEGVITVEEDYDSPKVTFTVSDGMTLDKGWKSPFLCNQQTGVYDHKDVSVLVFEGNITPESVSVVEEKLNEKLRNGSLVDPVVIFCETMSEEVTQRLENIVNNGRGDITVVEVPYFAEKRKAILDDLALYTKTSVYKQNVSEKLEWGFADKVIISQNSTSIIQNTVNEDVLKRIDDLKLQLETTTEKEFFQKRISQLSGKASVIKVGDLTDISRKEMFDRYEDSVCAVKSAVEDGIVAGGGSSLVYINSQMSQKLSNNPEQLGYEVIKKSLLMPYKTILRNASVNSKEFIAASKDLNKGYNVKTKQIEDLVETGVVDSVKSIKTALENAISVSMMLLNTQVIV